jgi:hypothetical protein
MQRPLMEWAIYQIHGLTCICLDMINGEVLALGVSH